MAVLYLSLTIMTLRSRQNHLLYSWLVFYISCQHGQAGLSPPGHLQPLGSHCPAEGEIATIDELPSPEEFYERYVATSTPVIFKGAVRQSRAYRLWTDGYLSDHYGDLKVEVDLNKVDNRVSRSAVMRMKRFLEVYNTTNCYLVQTLPRQMWQDVPLLSCVLCGGFTDRLQDIVVWMSAGGTKSKLHLDTVENINCLIRGQKDWFFVDPRYSSLVELDRTDSDFSSVDVDRVDMFASPGLSRVPWWSASTYAGDCIYVPYRWLHQVRSYQSNIAVNLWWTPMLEFNLSDCQVVNKQSSSGVENYSFSPGEQIRFFLDNMLDKKGGAMTLAEISRLLLHEHTGERLVTIKEFSVLDQNGDGLFEKDDLRKLSAKEIAQLIQAAPGEINTVGVFQSDFTEEQPHSDDDWMEADDESKMEKTEFRSAKDRGKLSVLERDEAEMDGQVSDASSDESKPLLHDKEEL